MTVDSNLVKLVAENSGWRGEDLVMATAIMMRESNGNPGAYNGNTKTGDNSYGLFQLNTIGNLWSIYQGMGFTDKNQLLDPANNIRAAYQLYQRNGNTFRPWMGYRAGLTVDKQLAGARAVVATAASQGLIPAQPGATSGPTGATGTASGGVNASPQSAEEWARANYGYLAFYLDDPTIGPILQQGGAAKWSAQMLEGALSKTDWWKTTQASAREWDAGVNEDPATAEAKVQQRVADMMQQAAKAGYTIDPLELHDMARLSLRLNWSSQQITNAIGAESGREGRLANSLTMQNVRGQANAYGVPLSDQSKNQWGMSIATGQATTEDYRQYLVGQAKALYPDPGVTKALDQGMTIQQYASPYTELAQQTLGVAPASIDLTDAKWNAALNGVDQKTGERRALTLDEWNTKMKSESRYGWQNTANAHAAGASFAANLGQRFGVYAR